MGYLIFLGGLFGVSLSLMFGLGLQWLRSVPDIPDINLTYWGPGTFKPDDMAIKPYRVHYPQSEVDFIMAKLKLTSPLAPPLEGVQQQYGINTNYLKELLQFWKTSYNWTEREIYLNKYPHFKTQIAGLNIVFIHVKPDEKLVKGKEVLPIVLVHGWPGTLKEFFEVIPLLTAPRPEVDFVFEVIVPSLPGFGYSDTAERPGMGPVQMATIINELMRRLGFDQYLYQGGDWGSFIGHSITVLYPERILGFHSNFCVATTKEARMKAILAHLFPKLFVEEGRREFYQAQLFDSFIWESGYFHIQATKPDTVGVGLTDSPIGLAGYILEKFSTITNKGYRSLPDAGLSMFKKEDLLDIIMIYSLSRSITSSMRIYYEYYNNLTQSTVITEIPVKTPSGCARFQHEILYYPDFVLHGQFENLLTITDFPVGGHFAAFEQPKLLGDDIWKFVETLKKNKKL